MKKFELFAIFKFSLITAVIFCLCHVTRAEAQDKENAEFKLAVGLYNDGMYDLASEQLKSFINAYPNSANGIEARFYLGLTQMKLKRFDEARITFQNFALTYVEHPKAPEAWLKVGDAFLSLDNWQEAANAYERVKVFHPKSQLVPEALWKAGQLDKQFGDRENAKKNFRMIVQDFPNDPIALSARVAISELYAEEGQTELAERELKRVSESDTSPSIKANALFSLGKLQLMLCFYDDAKSTFTKIISEYKNSPPYTSALYELGKIAAADGEDGVAVEDLKRAASDKNAPDSLLSEIYFEIGNIYNHMGNYTEAYNAFEKIFDRQRIKGLALRAKNIVQKAEIEGAWTAFRAQQHQKALRILSEIIKDNSHQYRARALALAGEIMLSTNRAGEAVKYYSKLVTEYNDTTFTLKTKVKLAKIYENQLKDYSKAITTYNEILDQFPLTPEAVEATIGTARCQGLQGSYENCLNTYTSLQLHYPAYSKHEEVQREIDFLRNHKIKDRDVGMEKLARLMSEILEGKSKSELSFKLGEIYFNELKDYKEAARQFELTLENNQDGANKADALYWLARSYELLSDIDSTYIGRAVNGYNDFLKEFPQEKRSQDAAFYRYKIESERVAPTDKLLLAKNFLSENTDSKYTMTVLRDLGLSQLQTGDTSGALASFDRLKSDNSQFLPELYLIIGSVFRERQQNDSALANWDRALTTPGRTYTHLMALWNKANLAQEQGDYNQEATILKQIIDEYPYSPLAENANEELPKAYVASGSYDDALTVYTNALAEYDNVFSGDSSASRLYYLIGTVQEKRGKRQEALKYLRECLSANRKNAYASKAFYSLGIIAKTEGRIAHASKYFKLAGAIGEQTASREIADILFQTEQYNEAARYYKQLSQSIQIPESSMVYSSRAIVSTLRMANVEEADRMIVEFNKKYPNIKNYTAEFTYERALLSFRNKDFTTSKKLFSIVADDYNETRFGPWGRYYLGKISEQTNKPEDAVKKFDWLLKNAPNSDVIPRVLLSLGNMHFNAERYEDAIRYYQQIVKSPELSGDILPYAMNNLIEAYSSTKLYDEAMKVTRDFIEQFPNDENIIDKKISLGTLYTKLGYYDQAILHLQNLIPEAGSQTEAELRYDIGEAYYYKGEFQQAILEFLKVPYVVSKQGKVDWTATALYMAGQSYEKMSKFEEAIGMYKQIIDRPGIDATFKSAARKEIDRVNSLIGKGK
jgi:TolA-binding protein